MNGVINVLKPPGMTSHDVVTYLRRQLKMKKIGHAGTLDPQAAGVLPVCVGQATRLLEYMNLEDKDYLCRLTLGISTTTLDAWGEVVRRREVPPFEEKDLEQVLACFRGEIRQTVPMYSAVKVGGIPLYERARRGENIQLPPRQVRIDEINLLNLRMPEATLFIRCSKGTYIRTLCQDIGDMLSVGGHMSFLLRTRVGPFRLDEALTLEDIARLGEDALQPMSKCLEGMERQTVGKPYLPHLQHGRALPLSALPIEKEGRKPGDIIALVDEGGKLRAIVTIQIDDEKNLYIQPKKVFTREQI